VQDAVPHHDFYVIKVHDSEGGFSAVPGGQREKLCQEFFHNGGITDQRKYLNINPVRVNMSMEP
jgi:hypothetical protein